MKRFWIVSIVMLTIVAVESVTFAQNRPDFSGRWVFAQRKSDRGTGGNAPIINFPSVLVVKQTAGELHVEAQAIRQSPVMAVYKFDGSEVKVSAPEGITETAKAMWKGPAFVIHSRRTFSFPGGTSVTEFQETWTVNQNELVIEKSRTTAGITDTLKAVFDRSTS